MPARKISARAVGAAALVVTAALVGANVALGYATRIHSDFYGLAFGDRSSVILTRPSQSELDGLRTRFYDRVAAKDTGFRARYPNAAAFDDRAYKEFLGLNPDRAVFGVDSLSAGLPEPLGANGADTEAALGRIGSVMPDDDRRNQDRLFTQGGQVQLDPFGRAIPFDPRTTWFGGLTGTPSQFDAHGATVREGKYGSGVLTAFLHPEHFARPPEPLGSAPEFSQLYTDLALQAKLDGGPGADWMAIQLAGNCFHGIEDLGNQIHTTLLGIPQFFIDAKLTYYEMKVKSFFSKKPAAAAAITPATSLTPDQVKQTVLNLETGKTSACEPSVLYAIGKEPGAPLTDTDLGIRIIGNHHRLLEDFFMVEYFEGLDKIRAGDEAACRPEVREVYHRALAGDKDFEKRCRDALGKAGFSTAKPGTVEFAKIIAEQMVDVSSPEAAPIYHAIRNIAKKDLRRGGIYPTTDVPGTDPRDYVTTKKDSNTDLIFEYHARAFARVVTALRLWRECFDAQVKAAQAEGDAAKDRIAERVAQTQMKYLGAAKARRDQYIADKKAEWAKDHPTEGMLKSMPGGGK